MIKLLKHKESEAHSAVWDGVAGRRAVLLTTFRRDGTPVPTPVGYAISGDGLYFMTDVATGKVKRIRRNRRVRVMASTLRGRASGPVRDGVAVPLDGDAAAEAQRRITSRNRLAWFFLLRRAQREGRVWQVYVVRPADEGPGSNDRRVDVADGAT